MARAIVKVTVEIQLADAWGNDWKLADVYKSASETARNIVESKLAHYGYRIVDGPHVTAVITDDK